MVIGGATGFSSSDKSKIFSHNKERLLSKGAATIISPKDWKLFVRR